jgi:hypothetical protein
MMCFLAVILPEPATDFPCGHPNDGIDGGIVHGLPCEDVDSERPFLQRLR